MDYFFDKIICYFRYRKVLKYISVDSVIFDIGCGAGGKFLKSISPMIKYGIGIDKNAIIYQDNKIELKKCNVINSIPFQSEKADIITMLAVLEHLEKPQNILNEVFRILKNNGKLIITVPTLLAKPVLEFLAFKLRLIDKTQIEDHKNYFREEQLKEMLLKAGFHKENIKSEYFEFGFNHIFIAKK